MLVPAADFEKIASEAEVLLGLDASWEPVGTFCNRHVEATTRGAQLRRAPHHPDAVGRQQTATLAVMKPGAPAVAELLTLATKALWLEFDVVEPADADSSEPLVPRPSVHVVLTPRAARILSSAGLGGGKIELDKAHAQHEMRWWLLEHPLPMMARSLSDRPGLATRLALAIVVPAGLVLYCLGFWLARPSSAIRIHATMTDRHDGSCADLRRYLAGIDPGDEDIDGEDGNVSRLCVEVSRQCSTVVVVRASGSPAVHVSGIEMTPLLLAFWECQGDDFAASTVSG